MVLAHLTWEEVDALDRETVVLIPTGSLEQHGPHLPMFTDSLLVTAVAEEIERQIPEKVLLVPTVWLGASAHHMAFAGSLTASMPGYGDVLKQIVQGLSKHRFRKFFVLNGHGGNVSPNDVALRELKETFASSVFAHKGYHDFAEATIAQVLEGPSKRIQHSCEAEVSLMMHLHPDKVRKEKLIDDGLIPEPAISSLVLTFDEVTDRGALGYATLATAEKGKAIFESAVSGAITELEAIHAGFVLRGQ